jgi:hypothetical protein
MTAAVEGFDRRARNCSNALRADRLDEVDLSRQVRGNLEADFLLTHSGLGPGLHDVFLLRIRQAAFHARHPAKGPLRQSVLFDGLTLRIEPSLSSTTALTSRNHTRVQERSNSASRVRVTREHVAALSMWTKGRGR